MTPGQVRVARALLGWSRYRLAALANIPPHAVEGVERYGAGKSATADRIAAMHHVFEAAGVEFTDEEASGVKLRGRVEAP